MSKQLLMVLLAVAFTSSSAIAKKVGSGGSGSHSVKGHVKKMALMCSHIVLPIQTKHSVITGLVSLM